LQDSLEQQGNFCRRLVAIMFGKLEHCVLDYVQRCLFIAYRKYGLLERTPFCAGEKGRQFAG
jgi:hypothetical protein